MPIGWTLMPSAMVAAPSVVEAPAHLECRIHQLIELGNRTVRFSEVTLVIAEVVCVTLDESICGPDYRIDARRLGLIGRMGFPWFTATGPDSMFELPRYTYAHYASGNHD